MEMYSTILLYMGIVSTGIFVVSLILTFMGFEFDELLSIDFDIELDSSPTSLKLTFRNLLSFIMGLSWGSLMALNELNLNMFQSTMLGAVIGLVLVGINSSLVYFLYKLNAPNNYSMKELIGKVGTVYLTIPPNNSGFGQVSVILNGSQRTLKAYTKYNLELKTGSSIVVSQSSDDSETIEVDPLI